MVHVKLITLDGYKDWNPSSVEDIQLDQFNQECLANHISKGHTQDIELIGDIIHIENGTISVISEEGGYIAVLME